MSSKRADIFKLLTSPGIGSKESISASVCSLAGRYDNPTPTRFLSPVDCYKNSISDYYHAFLV
jgi:hypothetical protein